MEIEYESVWSGDAWRKAPPPPPAPLPDYSGFFGDEELPQPRRKDLSERIVALLRREQRTSGEIATSLGASQRCISTVLTRLVQRGRVRFDPGVKWGRVYWAADDWQAPPPRLGATVLSVLACLKERPRTQVQVARALGITRGLSNSAIHRLLRRRLIKRDGPKYRGVYRVIGDGLREAGGRAACSDSGRAA